MILLFNYPAPDITVYTIVGIRKYHQIYHSVLLILTSTSLLLGLTPPPSTETNALFSHKNMDKPQQNQTFSHLTLIQQDMRGQELGEKVKVWKEVANCEARITLMQTMIKHQLAFADLEEF